MPRHHSKRIYAIKELATRRFGRLVAVRRVENSPKGRVRWLCQCDCGTPKVVEADSLLKGNTASCGCLHRDANHAKSYVDGRGSHPLYMTWFKMVARCHNPKDSTYANYGARGIKVCDRWRESFPAFAEDMGPRPGRDYTVDRFPDNDGDYEPANCRWGSSIQQSRNKHSNRMLTHNDETRCLVEWAELFGMRSDTLSRRLERGWSIERSLTTPVGQHKPKPRKANPLPLAPSVDPL